MTRTATADPAEIATGSEGLQALLDALVATGHEVFGPVVREGTIASAPVRSVDELPTGVRLDHGPGRSTIERTTSPARFGWASPPQAWKRHVHPPTVHTTTATDDGAVLVDVAPRSSGPVALFGLRPCDLAGIERLDTVLLDRPPAPEPTYRRSRRNTLTVVVNCGEPADTCFCTSTDTGPHLDRAAGTSADIEVTELVGGDMQDRDEPGVRYLIRPLTDAGRDVVRHLPDGVGRPASDDDERARSQQLRHAVARQSRSLPPPAACRTIVDTADDGPADAAGSRWDEVASRCLACGNCTAVCPTCFCTTIVERTDLGGGRTERHRTWDSCFSLEFSRLGGSVVRESIAARYRQWATHKVATWHDQFGESGCVGCGRCIVWCPVGIDLVDEVVAHARPADVVDRAARDGEERSP